MAERICYAWGLNPDIDMIATFDGENGLWDEKLIHPKAKGSTGTDAGICGINSYYHPLIVKHENFFEYKWQIEKCVELWKGGTTFYAKKHKEVKKKNFIITNLKINT